MTLELISLQVVSGLTVGMTIFLCAAGLTLILGSLKVLNIAHGSIYLIGAYLCYTGVGWLSSIVGHFYIAIILAVAGAAIVGGIIEILLIRPLYKFHHIFQFLTTAAVIFIVMDLVKIIWGGTCRPVPYPSYLEGGLNLLGIMLPKYNLCLILFGFAIFVLLYLFINKTRVGLIIRGVTVDRMMMSALGVNVPRVYTLIFMLGCALAGLAGAVIVPIVTAAPGMSAMVLNYAFIVIIIGGFGSIAGSLLGSILIGQTNAFGILFVPGMAMVLPFLVMMIVLIFRPWGLLGKPMEFA